MDGRNGRNGRNGTSPSAASFPEEVSDMVEDEGAVSPGATVVTAGGGVD